MDPIIGGALIAGGAQLAGSAFNAWQSEENRDFQREMSNTAHQRQVKDLRAAGINPLMSAKLGGASTPSGSSAQAASGDMGGGIIAQKALQKAQVANLTAQTIKTSAEARVANQEAAAQESLTMERLFARRAEYVDLINRANLSDKQVALAEKNLKLIDHQITKTKAEAETSALGVDKAKSYSDFYKGYFGAAAPYIEALGPIANSALDALGLLSRHKVGMKMPPSRSSTRETSIQRDKHGREVDRFEQYKEEFRRGGD